MPDFTVESWDLFKEQFLSVIRFVYYCFDMLFDTCRSNPMLYAFFFFPVFAAVFFIIFEMLVHIAPFAGVINNKQVKGVLSASKLSSKSYGKNLSSSQSVQNLAGKKAAQDAKVHSAMINKINSSGKAAGKGSVNTSGSVINSFSEGKKISGKSGWDLNTKKHKLRRAKIKAKLSDETDSSHSGLSDDKKVEEFDRAKEFLNHISSDDDNKLPGNKNANLDINPY